MFRARPGLATKTVSEVDVAHYQGITVAGDLLGTRAEVADLQVRVDAAGLTIVGPGAGVTRTIPWDRVSSIFTRPGVTGAKSHATALEVGFDDRSIEFLFPSSAYSSESILELMHHTTVVSGLTVASTIDFENLSAPPELKEVTKEPTPSRSEKRAEAQAKAKAATKAQRQSKGKAQTKAETVAPPVAPAVAPAPVATSQVTPRSRRGKAKAQIAPVKAGSPSRTEKALKAPTGTNKVATPTKGKQPKVSEPKNKVQRIAPVQKEGRSAVGVSRQANGLLVLSAVLVLVVVGLGAFFYRNIYRVSASPTATRSLVTDTALAANIGLSQTSLPSWTATSGNPGNPFASGAASSAAAKQTAAGSASRLAQCLGVPVADVNGALGIGSGFGGATAQSLLFSQPAGSATTASSSVSALGSDAEVARDMSVFADSGLFATCEASYVQSMLPFAATGLAGVTFSAVSVQPEEVSVPSTARVHVEAFRISRTATVSGQAVTIKTDAFAIYGGKVQATVTTTSNANFDSDTETSLVAGVEAKVAGDLGR